MHVTKTWVPSLQHPLLPCDACSIRCKCLTTKPESLPVLPATDGRIQPLYLQLCTASADGTLGVWDVESGRQTRTIAVGQPVVGLAVAPGSMLAHLTVAWKERGAGRVRIFAL